jgi:hypothetical protein
VNPPCVFVSLPQYQLPNSPRVNSQIVELRAMTSSPGSRSTAMITGKGREALATEGLERTWVMVKLGD